ncbi:fimbria/pilus outer membrane usher protein [Hafnia alvei]|uniref:fimbria/pilus outer membrane usher protein n=1 Tax=Hafnia alvei TaxID=569 RepID=UPI00061D3839|nr:fimbria/pilus outer membrane usher protein [Hafnia alvei]KID06028.2 hypothetical protein PU01_02395 [Hafnia alvei]MBW3477252.1 fimbria/pilus outer membrane usher protein [Hafnia alvei]
MSARAFFLINKKLNRFLLLFNLSFLPFSVIAANDTVDFDLSTLQARGLPTTLNDYFRTGSKFSPGMSKITPFINGVEKKTMSVNFDDQGELCLHREDLTTLGLKSIKSEDDRCIDLKSQYPQAEIKLEPGQNKVDFVLPSDAIEDTNNLDINQYAVGGIGGMLNYDVLKMKNHSKTSNIDTDNENDKSASNSNNINTFQSNTEEGFNFNDWIIRSRQSYSSSGDSRSLDQIYTYAQRTLPNYKTVMQTGKISVANSLFAIPQILGIQFSPESALMNNKESGATVTGIAQTQARVEVRQSGILIYSTQVPAGAFTLNRLPTINNTADLNVNVVEQDGATRSFLVPASSFTNSFSQQETSYSGAIGKIDQSDNDDIGSNELLTFNMSTPWGTRAMLNSGALLAQRYQSIAAQMSAGLANGLSLSGRSILSSDARSQTKGMQNYLSLSMPLVDRLSINSSVTRQDSGYRDLTDGMPHVDEDNDSINNRYKSQYSLGMGYSFEDLGSFNLSWSRVSMFSSDEPTSRMTAGWSKTFSNGTSVSMNAERDSGEDGNSMFYMNVSIPFGSVRVGASMSRVGDNMTRGVTLDQTINERLSYSLAANKSSDSDVGALSANVHALPNYSQINLGYSRYGSENSTYTVGASGGVVATKQGVLFSPYPLQDTYAVVQIPGISGGEIETSQGPVWSNSQGYAVSSGMSAYGESRMVLETKSLPKNVDVSNGIQVAHVARGSVTNYTFNTVVSRRALIRIHLSDGKLAEKGSLIYDAHDNYITTVASDGTIFLIDSQLEQKLMLQTLSDQRCQVIFKLNEEQTTDKLYESYDAQCQM